MSKRNAMGKRNATRDCGFASAAMQDLAVLQRRR
jgi:hypothetical protein